MNEQRQEAANTRRGFDSKDVEHWGHWEHIGHTDDGADVFIASLREPKFPEGVRLDQTCGACPEQYEAFFDNRQIGYLRLRHGYFYAAWPNVSGEVVYDAETEGDGCFLAEERADHLERSVEALVRRDLQERG